MGRPTKKDLKDDAVSIRRDRVLELNSQGFSQRQIATMLQISHGTVGNDYVFLRQKASKNIRNYIDKQLPEEYDKVLIGLTTILREAWTVALRTDDSKEKISALSLAKEVYNTKLDLLTNINVVNDAARFIELHKENKENGKGKKGKEEKTDNNIKNNNNNQEVKEETTNKVF